MSNSINVKNFILSVKNSQTYQISVEAFSKTTLWFITVILSIPIVASLLLTAKATATISLDTLRLNIGTIFLTTKMTSTVNNSLLLDVIGELTYKITVAISNSLLLSLLAKLRGKVSSTLNITTQLVLTMLIGTFNLLSDFDAETLGTMDVETLGDLDFTVA